MQEVLKAARFVISTYGFKVEFCLTACEPVILKLWEQRRVATPVGDFERVQNVVFKDVVFVDIGGET
jgi:hypothetical protein